MNQALLSERQSIVTEWEAKLGRNMTRAEKIDALCDGLAIKTNAEYAAIVAFVDQQEKMLTNEEQTAIDNFRRCNGRNWKSKLEVYWYNARIWEDDNGDKRDGYVLHSLRNSHGPTWLAKYKVRR